MRLLIFTGIMLFVIAFAISAVVEQNNIIHETNYTEFNKVYSYIPINITEELICIENATAGQETCNNPTTHIEYIEDGYVLVPIESSRVEKIENQDKEMIIIKNSYSDGKLLTVWKSPVGDRNFKEFSTCIKYEKDKGMCKVIPLE